MRARLIGLVIVLCCAAKAEAMSPLSYLTAKGKQLVLHQRAISDYKKFRSMKAQLKGLPKDSAEAKSLRRTRRMMKWVQAGKMRAWGLGPLLKLGRWTARAFGTFKTVAAVVGQDWLAAKEAALSFTLAEGLFGTGIRALRRAGRTEAVSSAAELHVPGLTPERLALWEKGHVIQAGKVHLEVDDAR